jgi:O-antigen ligase
MQQAIFWALIGVVCLSPLPLASNRPLPWSVLALSVGLLLLAWGVMRLFEPGLEALARRRRDDAEDGGPERKHREHRRRSSFDAGEWPLAKYTLVFMLGFGLLVAWYWLQTSRLSAPFAHPAWAEASASLGERLAGAISMEPAAGLTLLMKIMSYGGIFIMALHFGRDRHRARVMFVAIALSSAAYATYGLIGHFGNFRMVLWFTKTEYPESLTSTFINRNSYATYAGIGILAAMGPILQEIRRLTIGKLTPLRLLQAMSEEGTAVFYLLVVSIVLNISALVLTGSRAGFASAGFGIFVFLVMMLALRDIGLRHFISLVVLAVAVIFGFVALGGSTLIDRMANEGREARVDLFDVGRLAASERPLTGQGLASFSAAFNRANDGNAIFDNSWVDFAHNSYLELVVEGGMIGLIGSLALLGLMIGLMLQGVFTRARGTSFVVTGISCAALVGAHAMVDFSIQMPAVAATFLFLIGAASGQALPGAQSSKRGERARAEAEDAAAERRRAREEAAAKKSRRKKRRRRERTLEDAPEEVPVTATAQVAASVQPTMAENLRRLAAEVEVTPRDARPVPAAAKPEPALQAFGTDYASALERWRQLRAATGSETLVNDSPAEPHPDDRMLVEQQYVRTGEAPPAPAFDPSLSQPPTPAAWPGADTAAPSEPIDDGGLPPADPDKPSATIHELPRRSRDRQ